ncbi:MAG TPA: DUF6691 family protein [Burkholderiaceae bacterium]
MKRQARRHHSALLAGQVFGQGLMLSGMNNPSKVSRFLDLAGQWDTALSFVMGGALVVAARHWSVLRSATAAP